MKEQFKVRVSCLLDKVPQTSDNVASFIGPGAKVSVVNPIILLNPIQSGVNSSLENIDVTLSLKKLLPENFTKLLLEKCENDCRKMRSMKRGLCKRIFS